MTLLGTGGGQTGPKVNKLNSKLSHLASPGSVLCTSCPLVTFRCLRNMEGARLLSPQGWGAILAPPLPEG